MWDKNRFLKTAGALEPKLYENEIRPRCAVAMVQEQGGSISVWDVGVFSSPMRSGDSVCLDFGNHFVGHLALKLGFVGSHPDAPLWLQIQFAERPQELFENTKEYHGWISKGWIQQEQIHVDVLPTLLTLPRRYAFRYVKLSVLDASNKYAVTLEDCFCRESTSVGEVELLRTDDEELRKIDSIACRTLRNCMQKVFEDGPKRDRRLWLGDLRLQALTNYSTFRNHDLVKRCLYLFAGTADEEGRVSACLFTEPEIEGDDTFMFDYSLFFIAVLRDYWKATGDMETAKELYPVAFCQMKLAQEQFDEEVVRDSDVLGWCFVDWNLELNKQCSAQAIYIYCLRALLELAEGLQFETIELWREIENKKNAAVEFFWDEKKRLFVSGANHQISWASQVWMILAGVLERAEGAALLERISRESGAVKMVTPYLYHHYVDALFSVGERDKAISIIRSYWGGMVREGADTFWELYDPENPNESPYGGTIVNSFCHAWSCTPAWFLRKSLSK